MLVIGSYASPYVRKILVTLSLKGISYEIDPIIPFFGNDEFSKISPLRRIPVLLDSDVAIADSTIIFEYLEEKFPEPALLPNSPADRARARWIEEYCDSRLGDVIVWKLFFERVNAPGVFRRAPDEAIIASAIEDDLPPIMDWLESQAPKQDFLFGNVSIADISLACFFRNASLAGWFPDPARWPKAAEWLGHIAALPAFADLKPYEKITLSTKPADQRERLREAGAPISAISYGSSEWRHGIMSDANII